MKTKLSDKNLNLPQINADVNSQIGIIRLMLSNTTSRKVSTNHNVDYIH